MAICSRGEDCHKPGLINGIIITQNSPQDELYPDKSINWLSYPKIIKAKTESDKIENIFNRVSINKHDSLKWGKSLPYITNLPNYCAKGSSLLRPQAR